MALILEGAAVAALRRGGGGPSYDGGVAPEPSTLQGPGAALGWVLAQGVPAEIHVTGASMEPTLPRGTRVTVSRVDQQTDLQVGDIVVIASEGTSELVVHRLMHTFVEATSALFIHQGDAAGAAFGVVPRDRVVARVTGVPGLPPRFVERRLACRAYAWGRRVATVTGLRRLPVLRRCGQLFRRLASLVTG
jgi:signal peptidase I